MIIRISQSVWDYVHNNSYDDVSIRESWCIIAQDTDTGMYGYARLVREDGSCEEYIIGFEPDENLTQEVRTGIFDPVQNEYIDDDEDEEEVLDEEDDDMYYDQETSNYMYNDEDDTIDEDDLIDEDDPTLWED